MTDTRKIAREKASDVYTYLRTCCADKSHEEKIGLIAEAIKQARNEGLEEAAKVVEVKFPYIDPDVATAIRNRMRGEKP